MFKECQEVHADWTALGEGGMCESLRNEGVGHGETGRLIEDSVWLLVFHLHNKWPQTWKLYSQFCKSQVQALVWLGSLLLVSQGRSQGVGQAPGKNLFKSSFRMFSNFSSLWLYDWGHHIFLAVISGLLSAHRGGLHSLLCGPLRVQSQLWK